LDLIFEEKKACQEARRHTGILDIVHSNMQRYQGIIFITTLLAAGFMQGMKITAIISNNVSKYNLTVGRNSSYA
jgi:hypothetical protein